jgi:putative tricarboxylic transport membrane protein
VDILSNLSLGFGIAFEPINLFYCFIGALLGTMIGILPGLGPLATMAMLLPLTFGMQPAPSLIMLAGIYYGAQYGGSTTAILINLPGEATSAVTAIDGYQMARQGRAGQALAAAAISSFVAGTIATLLIAFVAQPMTTLALSFGSPEYFALLVLGLVSSIALASGSTLNALGMICLGLLLGLTGTDIYTGTARFTFGLPELLDGIDFVAVAVGIFGISEVMRNLENGDTRTAVVTRLSAIWPTRSDLRRIVGPSLRGTAAGSLLGILPGGGALLSSFVAYSLEKRVSRNAEEFGRGAIEGVAAPEAANNAGAQVSFVPMLTLGIPSNAVMAIMIGALLIQGITPGPNVIVRNADLFWALIASMWLGNVMLVILNLPLVGLWVSLLRVPYSVLFPAIVAFCCIGVYSIDYSAFGVVLIAIAGILGYVLVKLDCELPPFALGFILGPMLEQHLRRALLISDGDPTVFITRPLSATLLVIAAVTLVVVSFPAIAHRRQNIFVEQD